ncbi:Syntaxin-like protein psy1 [Madurella mycetomatis]|uniref:Syntaxin-like protein psy1 n=1 Tax=Madurella mycetomatis TaxID=100816 RepID=A0A175WA18_9PEZI|nr:Syntaxin-like protein psy1 [Madurella mycetomatis]KXX80576.1 Syntaxin-like protein psy1 [Madurella mycetomatis]
MSYNPYNQGPAAESGYGYGHGQPEQHEMQSYGQQPQYGQPQYQYGQQSQYGSNQPQQDQYGSPYHQQEQYGSPQPQQGGGGGGNVLTQAEFLSRVKAIRNDIQSLTTDIRNIATLHQQALASSDGAAQHQLDDLVHATQIKNTSIRSQIQALKADTERTTDNSFGIKKRQFETLNGDFRDTIQRFLQEEQQYKERYREQIARQYRIVNPDATDDEVQQAADADWGNEGVFQSALRTNRSGHASAVLGNVRARHNDMLKIERSIMELVDLLNILNDQIVQQSAVIEDVAQKAEQTTEHLGNANTQINKAVKSALNARKLKWWCLGIAILIAIVIALGVGLGVALTRNATGGGNGGGGQ